MKILSIVSPLVIAMALCATSGAAFAKPKHHVARAAVAPVVVAEEPADPNQIPLTVNRRSWLDPGPVAPRGTGNAYVTANTGEFIKTPVDVQNPDMYGNSELPGQPYVPGRTQPVVEFSTTPNGHVDVANELLPQNFYFYPKPPVPPTDYRTSFSSPLPSVP